MTVPEVVASAHQLHAASVCCRCSSSAHCCSPCCCSRFLRRDGEVLTSSILTQATISALTAENARTGRDSKGKLHRRGAGRWLYGMTIWKSSAGRVPLQSHLGEEDQAAELEGFHSGSAAPCWPRGFATLPLCKAVLLKGCVGVVGSAAPGRVSGSPQAADVLVAGCPAEPLVGGCAPQTTWKPSGAGAQAGAGALLNPVARWKRASKVQACVGASEFLGAPPTPPSAAANVWGCANVPQAALDTA